ncbi:hypothetical protein TBLA_0B00680 [Henningerozyma blattae CBS 6284]|uniref:Glycosyltransferase family 91 protein n=1 Tax=Henningerozyma blattae (strain ATCC 34711 / CBS 6284 / DSM 70876 / NBRC 10599 / NRRL Y-10934 / UCD 77-7) TaxID=1071380 RepID=I2GXQ9_HENB6|nr:hypothetical protein TBLA_0B00680 [Tetrapisispora blattae CBS 6284]CCH58911.1 hypothetical protein TBLA_0B00680 [Tetrapisispora blattae CBS 6284]
MSSNPSGKKPDIIDETKNSTENDNSKLETKNSDPFFKKNLKKYKNSKYYENFENSKDIFSVKYLVKYLSRGKKLNLNSKILFAIILLLCLIFSLRFSNFGDGNNNSKNLTNAKVIERKKDLGRLDLTSIVNKRSLKNFPISDELLDEGNYDTYKFTGYISNLNVNNLINKKQNEKSDFIEKHEKQAAEDLVSINELELISSSDYNQIVECEDLEYTSSVKYSKEQTFIEDDLIALRKYLLAKDFDAEDKFIAEHVQQENEKDKTDIEIVKRSWYRFGSSSVWMESEQCYVTVTRLMYCKGGNKAYPDISLIRAQTFDKNWKEIKGKRIPKVDVKLPKDIEKQIEELENEYDLNHKSCDKYMNSPAQYGACVVEKNKVNLENKKRAQSLIDQYFVTYPTVYKFPIVAHRIYTGPEDPRIVLRKFGNQEEPVVVFNMDTIKDRKMHAFLPHRALHPLVELNFPGMKGMQKNWAPFFLDSDFDSSELSRGYIHFVHNYNPLEILLCSLNDGNCEKVFTKQTLGLTGKNEYGGIRGGTQFVQLPSVITRINGKTILVGFSKLHINNCGCGSRFYRPMLNIIVEEKGIFHQELIVPSMDFNIEVLDWSTKSHTCKFYNILSPNSIAFWDVIRQDPHTKKFEDLLVFTFSEADEVSKAINVRGLLDYIINLYSEKDIEDNFVPSSDTDVALGKTLQCVKSKAENICREYGESHPEED